MSENNFFKQNAEQIVFFALAALVLAIYYQTVGFSFINLDDNLYVYDNPFVLSGINSASVKWAFTAFHSANWHPLTWLSHALDVQFFGLNAGGHHATNIVFHLINSILAFVVFRKMTGDFWKSAIVAALFAVHPAHVESVAWIAERKDVLSTMFWLLTMFAYLRSTEVSGSKFQVSSSNSQVLDENEDGKKLGTWNLKLETKFYVLTIVLFAFGLMSKPMLVTLPFVLLLMDFWSLERLKTLKDLPALLVEKIPLFVLSAVSAYVTILAQRSVGAVETLEFLPIGTRFLNSIVSCAKYVLTLFYPANMGVWYPYDRNFSMWQIGGAILLLLGITAFCVSQIRSRKYLLMGWLWFLGTLVPVIGIVQVGSQSMADRYTYIPFFGLFVMLVWGVADIFQRFKISQTVYLSVFSIVILIYAFSAFQQTSHWQTQETLYKQTLAVTKNNALIAHNLCHYLMTENRLDEAESYCQQAIEMRPTYSDSYNTLGIIEMKRADYAEAEKNFRRTLQIAPNYSLAYLNLATALALEGKPEEAEQNLAKVVNENYSAVNPTLWADATRDLAIAYTAQKNYEKAAENFGRAIYFAPNRADLRADSAMTLSMLEKYDEAQKQAEFSLQLDPNDARTYNIYGLILLAQNRKTEAAARFQKALQIDPNFTPAQDNLKRILEQK